MLISCFLWWGYRLQSSTPVSYCEIRVEKKDELKGDYILREDGSRPEVYTEEHDKVLGSTEMSWTLFVDGYGRDGKRIYDPIKGKTCHQCRLVAFSSSEAGCLCSIQISDAVLTRLNEVRAIIT